MEDLGLPENLFDGYQAWYLAEEAHLSSSAKCRAALSALDQYGATVRRGPAYVKRNFTYSNEQEAGNIWYHDHTLGNTRLGVYAGLVGFYIIRDSRDTGTTDGPLPFPVYPYEVPIAIQDKEFHEDGRLRRAPSTRSEFFGNVVLANGKAWPVLAVEPRMYRFRGGELEGGLRMSALVKFDVSLPLNNDPALALRDQRLGAILKGREPLRPDCTYASPDHENGLGEAFASDCKTRALHLKTGAPEGLSLGEHKDKAGRTQPLVGTVNFTESAFEFSTAAGTAPAQLYRWSNPVTERANDNTSVLYDIWNLTPDSHPIHFHLATLQLIQRTLNVTARVAFPDHPIVPIVGAAPYDFSGAKIVPPDPNELGPMDTINVPPGSITRILARYMLPSRLDATSFLPFADHPAQYVWHCHVLSHEDNEMMRPIDILPNKHCVADRDREAASKADVKLKPPEAYCKF
eukprot:tig00020604_g11842.t1